MTTHDPLMKTQLAECWPDRTASDGSVKSILFLVHNDDNFESRLQAALSVARAFSAHLNLLHIIPLETYTAVDSYGAPFVSEEIMRVVDEEAAKLRQRIEDRLHREDVSWSYEISKSPCISEMVGAAAFADLLVVGRLPEWREFGRSGPALLGKLLVDVRPPFLIPGDNSGAVDLFGTAVVAWNGSLEAANAVRGAVGMLKLASEVRVVRYKEEKDTRFPPTCVLEYLSRHSISAELDTRVAGLGLPADLIEYASILRASYLVMGAYSHSRAGEFLFGGVTRELLRACPHTLILAH